MRAAAAQNPGSAELRLRLATLLNHQNAFDDTIDLLTAHDPETLGFHELKLLAAAHMALRGGEHWQCAAAAARQAVVRAENDGDRATAHADWAGALFRLDQPATAVAHLEAALMLDPHNKDACKRLAHHLLRRDDPAAVIAFTDRLAAAGVHHARLLTSRVLAFARLGRIDAAHETIDLRRFGHQQALPAPEGWASIDAFNAALVDELGQHPGLRYGRYGTASRDTWRIDVLATGAAPLARQLLDAIIGAVGRHLATLPDRAHPWLAARPAAGMMRSWCVITEGDGFEEWHVHPYGWMSGVYYAEVPETVMTGSDAGGCLAFGLPEDMVGQAAAAAFGEQLVRPAPGLLMLFPSHTYHRTYKHGGSARRVCVAFDIWPE